jgi:hypothetical protein
MMSSRADTNRALPVLVLLACCAGACGGESERAMGSGGNAGTGATLGAGGSSAGVGGSSGAGGGAGMGGDFTCGPNVAANEVNNYSLSSWLSFPPVSVRPDSDLSFDWSGVTSDILGHELDPLADIDQVTVMMWSLSLDELEEVLNSGEIQARHPTTVPLTLFTDNEVSSGNLWGFTVAGNPALVEEIMLYYNAAEYPPDQHSYTVMIASGKSLGQGTRMIQSFLLDPESTNTAVAVTNTSTTLDYTVDIQGLTPTRIPAATAAIQIDWSSLTVNALGEQFSYYDIDRVMLGRYTETVAELEASFLDLELIAADLYQAFVPSGTAIDLSTLITENGQSFAGIDSNDTWVLALICGSCSNPAPWYLTLLEPCQ